ncbi:hypothetical protein [Falsiroseomonas sp. E2-1-a20]|uniref:hypothetical protein n=1 Tax=Falsiroseomonas sp. E2-1-a20 TaxID=3239300 RepID=UPI003F41643D
MAVLDQAAPRLLLPPGPRFAVVGAEFVRGIEPSASTYGQLHGEGPRPQGTIHGKRIGCSENLNRKARQDAGYVDTATAADLDARVYLAARRAPQERRLRDCQAQLRLWWSIRSEASAAHATANANVSAAPVPAVTTYRRPEGQGPSPQGMIHGKRVGCSQNLDKGVRRNADSVDAMTLDDLDANRHLGARRVGSER